MLIKSETLAVPVATTDVLLTVNVESFMACGLQIKPVGQNLDAFEVHAKLSADGDTVPIATTSGQYTSPAYPLVRASGNLTALAAGATGWLMIDLAHIHTLIIKASAAAAGPPVPTVSFHGIVN